MMTWFLNLFRKPPKIGEVWLINGPSHPLTSTVLMVSKHHLILRVIIPGTDNNLDIHPDMDFFHKILKIKRISKCQD